jgi:opacity protein-like surface antigen
MFRKIVLALSATAALAAAALAPTAASAWGHGHGGHHWRGGYGFGYHGPTYIASSPDCYRVKRVVETPWGPRVRRVLVCG